MINSATLPRAQAQFVDNAGRPTREFYDFLRGLITLIDSANGDSSAIADLLARVEALENEGASSAIIQGLMSVAVNGTLAGGVVQVYLQGDAENPGNTYYYGTDAAGERGWHAVSDALAVTPDLTITVGLDGVVTFGLADLPDAGGGTLQKVARDSKGRIAGTSAATTDDLVEGATNLYFTDERAQDAVFGDAFLTSSDGRPLVTSAGDFITSSGA